MGRVGRVVRMTYNDVRHDTCARRLYQLKVKLRVCVVGQSTWVVLVAVSDNLGTDTDSDNIVDLTI